MTRSTLLRSLAAAGVVVGLLLASSLSSIPVSVDEEITAIDGPPKRPAVQLEWVYRAGSFRTRVSLGRIQLEGEWAHMDGRLEMRVVRDERIWLRSLIAYPPRMFRTLVQGV